MGASPCNIELTRTFLKKAETRFTHEMAENLCDEASFRQVNVEESTVANEQGGLTYKVMRNFTKTDFKFDFGTFDLQAPNGQYSGCLTDDKSPCNYPATKVGGSGWQTLAAAYFRDKLVTDRHCIEEFRDIPDATSYLQAMLRELPKITNDRLEMFYRGLEYYYSSKSILANKISEIAAPYTSVADVENSVTLVDCNDELVVPSMLTPLYLSKIYHKLRDGYGKRMALGLRNNRPYYGMIASDEIAEQYHRNNPEIFAELTSSDRVNPIVQEYGLSQILGDKIVLIEDMSPYRANIDAEGKLQHVEPYYNTTITGATGAGYETITNDDWREADLEYVQFVGDKQFKVTYQDAFMPIAGDEMKEIGKKFEWKLYNKATCDDEDANWFHFYANSRFYVGPNFRRNLVGLYLPLQPDRLMARYFGDGDCPVDPTECNVLKKECGSCVTILACCDHAESKKLLVTFDQDLYDTLGLADGATGFIKTRDGDHLPVILEAQSAKDNDTFVVDFTPAGFEGEPCCQEGEMIEFYVDEDAACGDTPGCSSYVYDACPADAAFTTYKLFLERPIKCVAAGDAIIVKYSDGSTSEATSEGTWDPIARTLLITPAAALTPDQLCQKSITSICCVPTVDNECPECELDSSDTPCDDVCP